jgi:hypothetical protein
MANMPHIPMSPTELPRQRIHEVVQLPPRPDPFDYLVGYGDFPDGIAPKRGVPRSPKYIAQVEWAWSPMHNRIDAYYIHATRNHWILWMRSFDDNWWRWYWQPVAVVNRKGVEAKDAAIHLLREFWKFEVSRDTDHFHWINNDGLLSVEELEALGREVRATR